MHAQTGMSSRLKEVRMLLKYTQKGIGEAIGSKMRSWQEYELGNRMPGGAALQGLARLGVNVNWILTGEGPQLIADESTGQNRAQFDASTHRQPDTIVNAEILEDILIVLRQHQDQMGRRFSTQGEAALVAEIYQYLIEEEQPTAEDRARTLRLIRTILKGTNATTSKPQGDH